MDQFWILLDLGNFPCCVGFGSSGSLAKVLHAWIWESSQHFVQSISISPKYWSFDEFGFIFSQSYQNVNEFNVDFRNSFLRMDFGAALLDAWIWCSSGNVQSVSIATRLAKHDNFASNKVSLLQMKKRQCQCGTCQVQMCILHPMPKYLFAKRKFSVLSQLSIQMETSGGALGSQTRLCPWEPFLPPPLCR